MSSVNKVEDLGLENIGKIYHNISYEELFEHEVANKEGQVTSSGAFAVDTGIFTGRSPKDKYFVKQDPSQKYISWGDVNHPQIKIYISWMHTQEQVLIVKKA